MSKVPVIAVDGPSGTGKGALCQRLAEHLGWHYLDSGALYRALGFAAMQQAITLDAAHADPLAGLANRLDLRFEKNKKNNELDIILNGADVAASIRTEEAGMAASKVATIPAVRAALLARQHKFRQPPGLVADGRDMGTVVFTGAVLKIFLTASAEERAHRRYKQLKEKGNDVSLPALVKEIAERDERDRSRSVSPLLPATDAVVMDTTQIGMEDVFTAVLSLARQRGVVAAKTQ